MVREERARARGYKPQVVMELLDINRETLRYWRKHVDPNPHRHFYTSGVLLAYQAIKILIRKKHLPVEVLKRCEWREAFRLIESLPLTSVSERLLTINERTFDVKLLNPQETYDRNDLDLHYLPLRPVVDAHVDALLGFGSREERAA